MRTANYTLYFQVVAALEDLCADSQNTVIVVSGDSQANVENAVGNISGLILAASNGSCFALPPSEGETRRVWHSFDLGVNWEFVKLVRGLIDSLLC